MGCITPRSTSNYMSIFGGVNNPGIDIGQLTFAESNQLANLAALGNGTGNQILGYDSTDANYAWFTIGAGLTYTHATHTLTAAGSSGITINSTPITSGTNTRILYDNSGTIGEYTITGSGTIVAMAAGPTFTGTVTIPTSFVLGATTVTTTGAQLNYLASATGTTGTTNTNIVFSTSPTLVTPTLGVATATSINGLTISSSTGTLTIANTKTATINNTLTFTGTDSSSVAFGTGGTVAYTNVATLSSLTSVGTITTGGLGTGATLGSVTMNIASSAVGDIYYAGASNVLTRLAAVATGQPLISQGTTTAPAYAGYTFSATAAKTYTFPSNTDTLGALGTAQTWTAQNKFNNIIDVSNAITASGNAATVPVTYRLSTVTNNSAATLTITMTTASAIDGQMTIVRIYDFSAATQTITWVNTENSTVTAPTTSNGSTTLPLTVGFQYNSATSKWRCLASC